MTVSYNMRRHERLDLKNWTGIFLTGNVTLKYTLLVYIVYKLNTIKVLYFVYEYS